MEGSWCLGVGVGVVFGGGGGVWGWGWEYSVLCHCCLSALKLEIIFLLHFFTVHARS